MSILKSIFTALKGNVSNVGEAIVDSQAMTILEQEIREATDAIAKAKSGVRNLKAKAIDLDKKSAILEKDITEYTDKAQQALDKGDEGLAHKVAEKISEMVNEKTDIDEQRSTLNEQVEKLYSVIKKREKVIENNRTELEKAKTLDSIQKTRSVVADAMPTNDSAAKRVQTAMDRVKKNQAEAENSMDADAWMADLESGADVDAELAKAGIGKKSSNADDILAKLKKS